MCPMRFILVFFSLIIAGYLAFKALWFKADEPILAENQRLATDAEEKGSILARGYRKIVFCVWTLVDMASGRYLWKTMAQESGVKAKSVDTR